MAGVTVRIPGQANIIETKAALMSQAVAHQFSVITGAPAAPNDKVRKPICRGHWEEATDREAGVMVRHCWPTTAPIPPRPKDRP
jgi:hypothetical protein